eukprot:2862676-Rhodomonas_salina.1
MWARDRIQKWYASFKALKLPVHPSSLNPPCRTPPRQNLSPLIRNLPLRENELLRLHTPALTSLCQNLKVCYRFGSHSARTLRSRWSVAELDRLAGVTVAEAPPDTPPAQPAPRADTPGSTPLMVSAPLPPPSSGWLLHWDAARAAPSGLAVLASAAQAPSSCALGADPSGPAST